MMSCEMIRYWHFTITLRRTQESGAVVPHHIFKYDNNAMPDDVILESAPTYHSLAEAAASAFPPVEIDERGYHRLVSRAWQDLSREHRLDPTVLETMQEVMPMYQNPENPSVFAIRFRHPERHLQTTIIRDYVLPVRPMKWEEDQLKRNKQTDAHLSEPIELIIDDLPQFILKLHEYHKAAMMNLEHIDAWVRDRNWNEKFNVPPALIWYNATEYDFSHPIEFIDRSIHHITDRPFEQITDKNPITIPSQQLGGELRIVNSLAESKMEAPFEIQATLVPDANPTLREAGLMPAVRYGIDGNTAYIYAVQMGEKPLDTDLIKYREEKAREYADLTRRYFQKIAKEHPEDFRAIFGNVPKHIMETEDPAEFTTLLFAHLNTTFPDLYNGSYKFYRHWVHNSRGFHRPGAEEDHGSILFLMDAELDSLKHRAATIAELADMRTIPKRRSQFMRKLFQLDKSIPPDPEYDAYKNAVERRKTKPEISIPDYPEENIHDVLRPAVVSLAATLELMRHAGIHKVRVPTYLPVRWMDHLFKYRYHLDHVDNLQYTQTNAFVRLFRRVAVQVQGIEITQWPNEDGFLELSFSHQDAPLTSDNPILGEILDKLATISTPILPKH